MQGTDITGLAVSMDQGCNQRFATPTPSSLIHL